MTPRQRKFAETYAGNATEAARTAGYTGTDIVLANIGRRLLLHPEVSQMIQNREQKEIDSLVADRKDRMRFWTEVMRSDACPLSDRLRASELLAKAQMDFTERHEVVGGVVPTDQLLALMRARMEANEKT
jgi:phage terminase small subunit